MPLIEFYALMDPAGRWAAAKGGVTADPRKAPALYVTESDAERAASQHARGGNPGLSPVSAKIILGGA